MATITRTGRPSKLTPKVIRTLIHYVSQGNYFCTAANAAGISDVSFDSWLKQGKIDFQNNHKGLYFGLFVGIKRAEAKAEAERVSRIAKAGVEGNWLADITFLERRHRERWGRPAPIQVQVNETKEIHITHVEVVEGPKRASIEGEYKILPSGEVQSENDDDIPF